MAPNADQRVRLAALAKFLRELVPDDNFGMKYFVNGNNIHIERANIHTCGTVACAAGWGTALFPPQAGETDWRDYVKRVFGVELGFDDTFVWLFGALWHQVDNTPTGAAARIEYYLEHGLPDNIYDQQSGKAPLCYSTAN